MITMDAFAVVIGVFGLLGGMIAFVSFVSQRPTRKEMNEAIERSSSQLADELKYLRTRMDEIYALLQERR
ncbi:hypothetical protein [Zoogloea sp.]|uniref:hypothetical protein n=1 Tax=Zoogloea sp. TaxID=49181 RepID=UPI001415F3A0|nr:MAG: hypothetical protein F9K15_12745 [Zoogloea sp.]